MKYAALALVALMALFAITLPARAQEAGACTITIPISQTASTDLYTFGGRGRICAVVLANATSTTTFSLVEGTGSTCGTNTAALMGSASGSMTTGAGGVVSAVSSAPWLSLAVKGDHLCLMQSAATNISGVITAMDR